MTTIGTCTPPETNVVATNALYQTMMHTEERLEKLCLDSNDDNVRSSQSQFNIDYRLEEPHSRPLVEFLSSRRRKNLSKLESSGPVGSTRPSGGDKISSPAAARAKEDGHSISDETRKTRAAMLRTVTNRLRLKLSDRKESDLLKMAMLMEGRLFRNSSSISEYSDLSTLDSRIRVAATVKMSQQMMLNHAKQGGHRATILRKTLGAPRYHAAVRLVKDIKVERTRLVATKLQCSASMEPWRSSSPCCGADAHGNRLSLHKSMPEPVRKLYFDTFELLNAFDKAAISKLHKIRWTTLLQEGTEILENYLGWKQLNA